MDDDIKDKLVEYLKVMTWYHSEKKEPTGLFATIGHIETTLSSLNRNLENANNSSTKLSAALNWLTGVLAIAAIAQVVVTLLK
ncbi:MAG TPA: hypothetical protein VGE59_01045 [Patescibacteria group bacterium]